MLETMKTFNYEIDPYGVVNKVHIGFASYESQPQGQLNVSISADEVEGSLLAMTPNDLKEIAKNKIIDLLVNGGSVEDLTATEPQPAQ